MGLLQKLIEQASNPKGAVGSIMLRIMNAAHSGMMTWALANLTIKEDAVVLDIGTGGGKTLQQLSPRVTRGKLFGIDYAEQAVTNTIQLNRKDVDAGKINVQQANVEAIPHADNKFDLITAFQTHYFWPDLPCSMKEIHRVLGPGGTFLLVAELYKINYHMTAYKSQEEMEALLRASGFASVTSRVHEGKRWLCIEARK